VGGGEGGAGRLIIDFFMWFQDIKGEEERR